MLFSLEIHKVLTKISKEKDCEALNVWIKPCESHLMWSAMSTPSGDGDLIWAKFKSYLSHVVNRHSNLEDPIFNKCAHPEIISYRQWLQERYIFLKYLFLLKVSTVESRVAHQNARFAIEYYCSRVLLIADRNLTCMYFSPFQTMCSLEYYISFFTYNI